ncbi:MAG: trypsin-like peptidase domain-containing protein [Coriobacteriales bacterium]|nr:trypsin-like peptidase domain-containing protein [Coriobacteriales bacterium]
MTTGNNTTPPIPGSQDSGQKDPGQTLRRRRVVRSGYPTQPGVPGTGASRQAQPEPPEQPKQGSGAWKGVVGGAVAGAAVSAALIGVLMGTGVIGARPAAVRATSDSSAGQTINLATSGEDATVSEAVAAKCLPSVVSVYVTTGEGTGIGSGVVLDTDGNIITNWHVAGDAESISVTMDGQSYDATLVGGDASSDIAVIKADFGDTTVTPMEVGDSSQLVVGDWVMTLGSPLGLDQSASSGIVSALYRNTLMASSSGNTIYTNLIQVDAAINGGNSGGALVNDEGKLVGINTLYSNAAGMESFAGIGFAIPGNYAVEIANKVIAGEQVTHAYMGVSCATVNAQNAQANHLSVNQGAYVSELAEDSPAAKAGIEVGDIVTKIGTHDVTSADGLILAVRSYAVGDEVDVVYVRGNDEHTTKVTLGSDEALQAQQEEERKKQEEQYEDLQRQYEEYLNQRQNQPQNQQEQTWPWDSYSMPWETWDWNTNDLGGPGMR